MLPYPNAHTTPIANEDTAQIAVIALTSNKLDNAAPSLTGPRSISQREQIEVSSFQIFFLVRFVYHLELVFLRTFLFLFLFFLHKDNNRITTQIYIYIKLYYNNDFRQ